MEEKVTWIPSQREEGLQRSRMANMARQKNEMKMTEQEYSTLQQLNKEYSILLAQLEIEKKEGRNKSIPALRTQGLVGCANQLTSSTWRSSPSSRELWKN